MVSTAELGEIGGGGPRVLALEGAENARDLGGLPLRGGGRSRRGQLFRSELLLTPSAADLDLLRDGLGLRTVVDLRTRPEIRELPGEWVEHGIAWVHCPVDLGDRAPVPPLGADYAAVYLHYLDRAAPVALAARTLIDPASRPALFHCAVGKDRTGAVGALLLDALGVERAAIAADYELTARAIAGVIERLRPISPYDRMLGDTDVSQHVPAAATIVAFLERVDERFGGSERWLHEHAGVSPAELQRFREDLSE